MITRTIKHEHTDVRTAARDKSVGTTNKRSPEWHKVQKKHLEENPTCAACGSTNKLDVHHKKPFHLHPELELDPNNLITLCMDNDCHLLIGHGDNFKAYNPNVVEDAATVAANKSKLKEIITEVAEKSKKNRLME